MESYNLCNIPIVKTDMPEKWNHNGFTRSKMVQIEGYPEFVIDLQYPKMHFKNAVNKCYVRAELLERLKIARGFLPKGYTFKIYDGWRPMKLQEELYEAYSALIIDRYNLDTLPEGEKGKILSGYISPPVHDRDNPPVHTTGGAIDLTIVDSDGNELNMGTAFDEFSDKAHTAYFENTDEEEIKRNRRLLYYSMINAGFTNLPTEWWHYDYGDKFWAYYNKTKTLYKGLFTKEEFMS
jgi:D-ala-D-ala dipeptidase.